jgi:hypothetical protein
MAGFFQGMGGDFPPRFGRSGGENEPTFTTFGTSTGASPRGSQSVLPAGILGNERALRTLSPHPTYLWRWEAGLRVLLIALAVFASDLLGRFTRWLTFRRVVGIVAILILLMCTKGLIEMGMGADLPVLFGLDWGLAIEVSALMIVLSVRDHVSIAAYVVKRWLLQHKPVKQLLRRGGRRSSRSRAAAPHLPPPPDDEPAAWAPAATWRGSFT